MYQLQATESPPVTMFNITRNDGALSGCYDCSTYHRLSGSLLNRICTQDFDLSLQYDIAEGWQLTIDLHYLNQASGSNLPVRENKLLNACIVKTIFADKNGQLRFAGYDLLGGSQSIGQSVDEQSVETYSTTVPQRLFLLSLSWNFKKTFEKAGAPN